MVFSSYRSITSATWLVVVVGVVLLTLTSFAEGADVFVGSTSRYRYSPNLRGNSRRQLDHKITSGSSRSKKVKEDTLQDEENTIDTESNSIIAENEQEGVVGNRVDETDGEQNEIQIPIEEAASESRTLEVFKYVLRSEDVGVDHNVNAFSGDLLDQRDRVVGNGLIYCTEQFLSVRGICWLEYNVNDVNGNGPGTIVAFGSLPSTTGSPITLTVTGIRGAFLEYTLSSSSSSSSTMNGGGSGSVELLLLTPDGTPDSSQFFSKLMI